MSERQAKTKRKNEVKHTPVKKKSALDIISNIIIVILILTVLGIGGWAVYSKFSQMPPEGTTEDIATPTISETAQEEGISVEEFLANYGLSEAEGLTGDTEITEMMPLMTLENYAKFSGADVETIKQGMGLTEDYSNDTLMSEILADMTAATEQHDHSEEENTEE